MINWFLTESRMVYDYIENNKNQRKNRHIITGVDMFSYEDYPVALCDTEDEIELIVLMRKEELKSERGYINPETWLQRKGARMRERLI